MRERGERGGCTEEFAPRRRQRRERRRAVEVRCMVFLVGGELEDFWKGMLNWMIALGEGSHGIGLNCRGEVAIGIEKWR